MRANHMSTMSILGALQDLTQRQAAGRTYSTGTMGDVPRRPRLSLFMSNSDDPLKEKLRSYSNTHVMEVSK